MMLKLVFIFLFDLVLIIEFFETFFMFYLNTVTVPSHLPLASLVPINLRDSVTKSSRYVSVKSAEIPLNSRCNYVK
jgi:hypothetical protein